jgi:hypothetical protein
MKLSPGCNKQGTISMDYDNIVSAAAASADG